MKDIYEKSIKMHRDNKGKIEVNSMVKINNKSDLSLAYSPGVAGPCLAIKENRDEIYNLTSKGNLIAVVSDGSAVLGLGNIGSYASLPVMEGKAVLFKEFADVNAIPICLDTQDSEIIVEACKLIAPSIGGINLEDISAPRCFEIENRLKKELDIPVFHDDQHGTAIVCLAGIINSCRLTSRDLKKCKVVVSGTGAAGLSIINLLSDLGVTQIYAYNKLGVVNDNTIYSNDEYVKKAYYTGKIMSGHDDFTSLFNDADIFIGVSAPNIVNKTMVARMSKNSIVFALANPIPEIFPEDAKKAGALVVGTGRSDYPNQVNNVLAFPGIFRGALDARVKAISEEMKIAAAYAIANIINENELTPDYIIPSPFNKSVALFVSEAIYKIGVGSKYEDI
ncbi:MAG: NADP-dependent malic enzyme [Bacilli bacterium]